MKFSQLSWGRIAHLTGRYKPVHGSLTAAIQAADTREMSKSPPLKSQAEFHVQSEKNIAFLNGAMATASNRRAGENGPQKSLRDEKRRPGIVLDCPIVPEKPTVQVCEFLTEYIAPEVCRTFGSSGLCVLFTLASNFEGGQRFLSLLFGLFAMSQG